MNIVRSITSQTAAEIVAALESAGEEVLVASECPLVAFHCSGPDSPVNCLLEKPWSAETMYCGFVCDDGVGENPAVRFASENVGIEWLLGNTGTYIAAVSGEHEDSLWETKTFRNEFLRGGLDDSVIARAVSGFDTAGYGRWLERCRAAAETAREAIRAEAPSARGFQPVVEYLDGQESAARFAWAGHDGTMTFEVVRDFPDGSGTSWRYGSRKEMPK